MSTTGNSRTDSSALGSTTFVRPPRRQSGRQVARGLGLLAVVIAALAGVGAAYEMAAGMSDRSAYSPPGRLVDIGGYRLHIDCRGEGSPTVVMDAGLGGSSLDWTLVQPELAKSTRVCVYDRAGMGWSEASPFLPRSPGRIAEELHLLLETAGVPGPYVLVAHSLAGKNARMFAAAYPEDVAGMVLVDTRSERIDAQTSKSEAEAFLAALEAQATAYSLARRLGIARLFGAALVDAPLLSQATATKIALLQTQQMAINATVLEGRERAADDLTLTSASLGSIPLAVVAAAESMEAIPGWTSAQEALAASSTSGRLIVAPRSSHAIHLDEPDVVIESVRSILMTARL